MEIQKPRSLILFMCVLCVLTHSKFGCGNISCKENEKQAVLLFKQSLARNQSLAGNLLELWVAEDVCLWYGIACNDVTGQVTALNLPGAMLQGSISESIGNLTALTMIVLSDNMFKGVIPESIGALKSLTILDLRNNNLRGFIPQSIGKLTSLTHLDLSQNKFGGLILKYIANLTSLSSLSLSSNKFDGSVPAEIGNLTKLLYLDLSTNQFYGCLPESFCQLTKLTEFDVSNNQLSGSIPICIGELSYLESLDLTSNSWEGIVSEHHFVNLSNLNSLQISSKSNLVLKVSDKWVPPFQLKDIWMDSVNAGPKFPKWLLSQRSISMITMTNTSISDTLLAIPNSSVKYLELSNNHLFGKVPAFLCNLTDMEIIQLSNNQFSGELPKCLGNLTSLEVLDVMNNDLYGYIPISLGSLVLLRNLNLHNNKFQGRLPLSFVNLTLLVGLDVGKNNLTDVLPSWELRSLRYLILRFNHFYGKIPTELCHCGSIQVLNLAMNHITGNIPRCFGNFTHIVTSYNPSYDNPYDTLGSNVIMDDPKGSELAYTSTLELLFSIDLSNNNISGVIPEELMDLRGLLGLNLAGNHLSGRIPDKIGKLVNLEFLDLSRNELNGSIPPSLSYLNFLSHLNLSFNDLSGRIPDGNQLQTLNDPSIYVGNNQLHGGPIPEPFPSGTDSHGFRDKSKADFYSDDEHMWFYAGIGPGLLVGFLGFCGSLHFIKSWRYFYFHHVQQVFDKIAVSIALFWRKFRN